MFSRFLAAPEFRQRTRFAFGSVSSPGWNPNRAVVAESKNAVSCAKQETAFLIGRDERIRTSDPHTPSVMRYQAALRPDRSAAYRHVIRIAQASFRDFLCGSSG